MNLQNICGRKFVKNYVGLKLHMFQNQTLLWKKNGVNWHIKNIWTMKIRFVKKHHLRYIIFLHVFIFPKHTSYILMFFKTKLYLEPDNTAKINIESGWRNFLHYEHLVWIFFLFISFNFIM